MQLRHFAVGVVMVGAIVLLTGCQFGDTKAGAEREAQVKVQGMLDDFRAEFVETLDTNQSAEELRSELRTEPFGLDVLIGFSKEELQEAFGEEIPALLDLTGSGDEIDLHTFFAAPGQAGGGGSYEKLRMYFCADITGTPGAELADIETTLVPCSDTVRDSLTRNNIDIEADPDQIK